MERIDKELRMPQGWYFFVKKQKEKQNFIIKTKGKCTCRNCNTEFETNKKSLGHYGLGAYINDSEVSLVVYPGNKYQSQFKAQTEGNHSLAR